ncbi:NERD domain-containing protein [Roseiconus lacunae]|uniref:nuclease-related domain-containing DEAD/DEAH box helicase n=1 Tax=Roseiconus lacunae TaxID=2605694 RepID=UPI0030877AC3|nr:NERD domain-containing protein [Stieleria sp. HD01]
MAKIIPHLDELALGKLKEKSRAEARVYQQCESLGSDFLILFSVPWINVTPYGTPKDGETDFIVFHPEKGILVIEVKGGGVAFDPTTDTWTSRDASGEQHSIKNPFWQARNSKYALIEYLKHDQEWPYLNLRPVFGHAVLLPDISDASALVGPDRPPEIVGTQSDVSDLDRWIGSVYQYWTGQPQNDSVTKLGSKGMGYVDRHFCSTREAKPLLSIILRDEEEKRIELTREQGLVIAALKQQRRAAIAGGAGTGKTVLAVDKATDLASQGLKTLLLCYNEPLADLLNRSTESVENLNSMSFHQLCSWFVGIAKNNSGTDYLKKVREENPGKDDFDYCFPMALAESIDYVKLKYDAIVIDEGQDFRDEYWLPIEILIEDDDNKQLFVFYDHNQRLYSRSSEIPITSEPFLLTRNCRNTNQIHELAYQFYSGPPTESSSIPGADVEILTGPSRAKQAARLHSHLTDLLVKEEVEPGHICVLVPSQDAEQHIALLQSKPLPNGVEWSKKEMGHHDKVCIETVKRFKGLEATYIYIWGADEFEREKDLALLYTILSRAKSRICLVGIEQNCRELLVAV